MDCLGSMIAAITGRCAHTMSATKVKHGPAKKKLNASAGVERAHVERKLEDPLKLYPAATRKMIDDW